MAADPDAGALGARDHDGRVPPGRVQDLALDLLVAGEERLVLGRDGVDVVRAAHLRDGDALLAGALDEPEHEVAGAFPSALVDGGVERVEPFLGLFRIEVRDLAGKAANDDRVAIGSGSHAVPSLYWSCRALRAGRQRTPWTGALRGVAPPPSCTAAAITSSLPRGNPARLKAGRRPGAKQTRRRRSNRDLTPSSGGGRAGCKRSFGSSWHPYGSPVTAWANLADPDGFNVV